MNQLHILNQTRDAYTVLKDFGLPLAVFGWGLLSSFQQNHRRLSIRQVGSSVTDTVAHSSDTSTVFTFELVITNDSPHATIVIAYFDLDLPWHEDIDPLSDPKDSFPVASVRTG